MEWSVYVPVALSCKLRPRARDGAGGVTEIETSVASLTVSLTAGEALRWIARAYIAAMPYRPTHSELIRCAGMLAREAAAKAGVRA